MKTRTLKLSTAICMSLLSMLFAFGLCHFAEQGPQISGDDLSRYSHLDEIYKTIKSGYYEDIGDDILLTGAERGMLDSLNDPYSFYYTAEEMQESQQQRSGQYYGIGIQLLSESDNRLIVTRVFKNSPAESAGIMTGDVLIAVDGIFLAETDNPLQQAKALLQAGESISSEIVIIRIDKEMIFTVEHRSIQIDRADYCMLAGDIGYIAISEFTGNDVESFSQALDELTFQSMKALIIDLRYNPGGLLDDVVSIADMILDEGLVITVEDRQYGSEDYYSHQGALTVPLAILVNGSSASASEVLAGAVQDHQAGIIVGETTFGKGIVQTIISFEDGSGLQLTTGRYFTPSGRCIHETGIEPDITAVQADEDTIDFQRPDPQKDTQLRCAMEALIEQID